VDDDLVWLMAFGGVFAADDLEQYVPGATRNAQMAESNT